MGATFVDGPNGGQSNVTVTHEDSPDKYKVASTVPMFAGAKTIAVHLATQNVYLFKAERGPLPAGTRQRWERMVGAAGRKVRSLPRGSSSLT